MRSKILRKAPIALAVSAALLQSAAFAYESPVHTFSINDVLGGFDGRTFGGTATTEADASIICDLGNTQCPPDNQPFIDKSGVKLYPVDSEFGYYVVDFLGAQGKARDYDYLEGFVGNIEDGTSVVGIQVANAPTLKYKVKPPLGTWCQGLGGTSVKCETEHYTVMEHVQSCHETIPYKFANPITGEHQVLSTPDGSLTFDCANAPLDDNAVILAGGEPTVRLINSTPCEEPGDPAGCQMFPNDKTDMQNNIALTTDYSVQLKDDGKPLYGWGGVHKRPNDIRMYARLKLPEQWKENPDEAYVVTKAHLVVNHWITNNPNDQLRPEDLENEAATGRKPSYKIEGEPGGPDEIWRSTIPCYEGDGDFIEGETPATPIGVGTVLKNMPYALDESATPGTDREADPYAFSSDLYKGLTNAYYTTINRDPFEWSYDSNPSPVIQDFVGSPVPDDSLGEFISGPRWRLKPNKFGQDLPGLEIPLVECSAPPFKKDNIKYVVGEPTTTIINLLDWDEEANGPSPLSTSTGWIDYTANEFITVDEDGISSNGLPMSEDFDLAVYIKGDAKSTAVYNAQLILEYEGEVPEPPGPESFDLTISLANENRILAGDPATVVATVTNLGPDDLSEDAVVEVNGITNRGTIFGPYVDTIGSLVAGDAEALSFPFTAPEDKSSYILWTVTVAAASDANDSNNTATDKQLVRKK
jgi:hypothetical protein